MKIMCILGTRPEAIKMAPVILEIQKYPEQLEMKVCVTGQHRQMLDSALSAFGITPDYDLDLMQSNQDQASLTASLISHLAPVLNQESPGWVLVQGDTTTAMAGSLVAYYQRRCVGHIEAGLRTGNRFQPFPEEINRKIVDSVSDLLFAPTQAAKENLLREGCRAEDILLTGNTVVDALLLMARQPNEWADSFVRSLPEGTRLILVTTHRRENFGQPLLNICAAIRSLVERYDDIHVVLPVHLNPNVRDTVHALLGGLPKVTLLPPLDYGDFVHILPHAHLILTDSGGIQEEAPTFGVPVLVLREKTERMESVEAGVAKLAGTDTEQILALATQLLDDDAAYQKMARGVNPYGDGHASERIVQALLSVV
jgi:UDP-N-acetylglucosamine 2-epimerase (non-hydrolysing)